MRMMILNTFASIIFASFALNALADEFGSSALKVLNEANFNSFLENHEVAFIKFYAPWCGHCKKLAPVWDELAEAVKDSPSIGIGKIDVSADNGKSIGTIYEIKGFPTLKLIANQKLYNYKGPRDLEALKTFVTGGYKTADASRLPKDKTILDNFQEFLKEYLEKIIQVIKFDLTIPIVFMLFGFILGKLMDFFMPKIAEYKLKKSEKKIKELEKQIETLKKNE